MNYPHYDELSEVDQEASKYIYAIHFGAVREIHPPFTTVKSNRTPKKLTSNNKAGMRGISWNEKRKEWRVIVGRKYMGSFKELADAIRVRKTAE